jgi:hypothetical protein
VRLLLLALILLTGTGQLFAQSTDVQKRCEDKYAAAKSAGALGDELSADFFVLVCSVVLVVSESPGQTAGSANSEPPPQVVGTTPSSDSTTYSDAFAYCNAVKEADRADKRYTGPALPAAVIKAVGPSSRWRCSGGNVFGCAAGKDERKCLRMLASKTPTAAIQKYCIENPSADVVPTAVSANSSSTWKCRAGFAVVVETSRTDQKGYVKGAWQEVKP